MNKGNIYKMNDYFLNLCIVQMKPVDKNKSKKSTYIYKSLMKQIQLTIILIESLPEIIYT